ncbi:MAG: diaminopimelate decarboxylase [Burkholderiales bacterium]|jgi:diaminopimelate decarboxylase|nr:diaminopimelate decarboxylase [Burkholderiales bacterium]
MTRPPDTPDSAQPFVRRDGALWVEGVSLDAVAARYGTPCYVYSRAALEARFRAFDAALAGRDHLVCYAMKANSTLAILDVLARLGAGFDIVSGGELARVLAAGGDAKRVVFSGVGKREEEMRQALAAGILCFNVESASELERLDRVAGEMRLRAPVSFRVNPDVDPKTHPYISTGLKENKFGIAYEDALALYRDAARRPNIAVVGIDCHIGSQITEVAPYLEAVDKVLSLVDRLAAEGMLLHHLDFGGGFGIRYRDENPPEIAAFLAGILARVGERPVKLMFEPGRWLVGNAGLLLTRVEYLKHGVERNFAIVDAAMNDLMRPALYDAWHEIVPVAVRAGGTRHYEIVGPVCESGDFLGRERELALAEGDLVAVMSAGAYGMSMSSNYNTRPRAAEVLVDGAAAHLVRERERVESLFALERRLPG